MRSRPSTALCAAILSAGLAGRAQENPSTSLEPELNRPSERGQMLAVPPPPVPLEGPLDPERYLCGAGDVFELIFWGAQNFKLRATADLEGRAFLARTGSAAAGAGPPAT